MMPNMSYFLGEVGLLVLVIHVVIEVATDVAAGSRGESGRCGQARGWRMKEPQAPRSSRAP